MLAIYGLLALAGVAVAQYGGAAGVPSVPQYNQQPQYNRQPTYHQPQQQYQQPQQYGSTGGCADTWQQPGQCKQWAAMGECNKNPYFMNWKCKQSCGQCGGSGSQGGYTGGHSSGSINWPSYQRTSDGCFVQVNNYAWKCLQQIGSQPGANLDTCLAACSSNSQCKSVVVATNGGSCDLYGEKIDFIARAPASSGSSNFMRFAVRHKRQTYVAGNQAGCGSPELCKTSGYNYYESTGQCTGEPTSAPATTTTSGPVDACPAGQIEFTFTTDSGDETACLELPASCSGPGYLKPQTVLVGFARVVYTVASREECYVKCATETEFDCASSGSGLYFAEGSDNCILNEETEATQPDQIAPNPGSDYFELRC